MDPNTQQELTPPKKAPSPTSSPTGTQQVKDSPVETQAPPPQASGVKEITVPKEAAVQKTGKKKLEAPKVSKNAETGEITIS